MTAPAEPVTGAPTPWGAAQHTSTLAPGIVVVSTSSHGGIWLSPERQGRIPEGVQPINGRAWYEEDCEWALVFAVFDDVKERAGHLGNAIRTLATWNKDWLDLIAKDAGIPNCAQIRKIDQLWERFQQPGQPDLAAFRSRPGSSGGFVEGEIGLVWFGISPEGDGHS